MNGWTKKDYRGAYSDLLDAAYQTLEAYAAMTRDLPYGHPDVNEDLDDRMVVLHATMETLHDEKVSRVQMPGRWFTHRDEWVRVDENGDTWLITPDEDDDGTPD